MILMSPPLFRSMDKVLPEPVLKLLSRSQATSLPAAAVASNPARKNAPMVRFILSRPPDTSVRLSLSPKGLLPVAATLLEAQNCCMKICCISDTHEMHERLEIPQCDLLLHAGDITFRGDLHRIAEFDDWCHSLVSRG